MCPEHYTKHLVEVDNQPQNGVEIKKNRDSCTDVIFFLAKDNHQKMSDILKNLRLPYLKDLNDFCIKNHLTYSTQYSNGKYNKCISSHGSSTFVSENHTCTCEWVVSFDNIKYHKIALKTYQFDIPDENNKGDIGSITLLHCKCHSSGNIYKFGLKPI